MPLFGPPNIEKLKARRDVKGLIKALEYQKDAAIPQQAALALGQIGDVQAIKPLILALDNYHAEVWQAAIKALANIGTQAVEPLIVVLGQKPLIGTDVTGSLRYRGAIEALGKIGDKRATGAIIAFIKPILQGIRHDDKFISTAVQALSRLSDPSAVEPLITILRGSPGLEEGWKALVTIGPPAIKPLIAELHYSSITTRFKAGETLAKLGWKAQDNTAIAPLLELLNLPNQENRQVALEILGKLGWKPEGDAAKAQYNITTRQWDQCAALGQPAVAPLINALRDEQVRENAAGALVKIGKLAVEPLIGVLQGSCDVSSRDVVSLVAAEALGKIKDERAVEPLITLLGRGSKAVRQVAARALIAIYRKGNLSDEQKTQILAQRDEIIKEHLDTIREESCWHPGGVHHDTGIGVDFPL